MITMISPRSTHRRSRRSLSAVSGVLAVSLVLLPFAPGAALAQEEEDLSVASLYQAAAALAVEGKFADAVAKYEKLFDLAGEFLCEDFGAQSGGIVFDYGIALLQMQAWEKARDAFERCFYFEERDCDKDTIKGLNIRKKLALFQWGFCEAQLGNHARALELYDQYLETAKGDPAEMAKIRNAFKLRRGTSLIKIGRLDEGAEEIKSLFDNRVEWKVSPQFLAQGLLELGLGWVELAKKGDNPGVADQIEQQALQFLDQNADSINVGPVDKFRFGFIDRLKLLGFESSKAGMQALALRFFSMIPTLEEVEYDLQRRIQTLPGQAVPATYQAIIDQIAEQRNKPFPPDAEMQRIVARAYELLGNIRAPREIYSHLAEAYPDLEENPRAEILHEAARFSFRLGDYSTTQYYGELFMAEMPEHRLRANVEVFMLQSLFSSGKYDQVIQICEAVRERSKLGDAVRELPDALYGVALYSLGRYEEAQTVLDDHVKTYKDSPNREMVMYYRANNRMIMGDYRQAADLAQEFLEAFPDSKQFGDLTLSDLALCRYNLEDYTAAVAAVEKLEESYPQSQTLDRSLNIKGDAFAVRSGEQEEEEEIKALLDQALETYRKAIDVGRSLEASGKDEAFHKEAVAESTAKAVDILVGAEKWDEAVALYDSFFPSYAKTRFEPQISVYSMEALEKAGRGEDGLTQLEKMINVLGNQPPEEQDLELLRQCIGSYSEASVRVRGAEKTLSTLGNFPDLDPNNQALLTWLKMQKVIVLQGMRDEVKKGSPEYESIIQQIDTEFREMDQFDVKALSEIALKMIGDYLSGSDNPFLAVRYYEELLLRDNPDADRFKASADLGLGRLEAQRVDKEKQNTARERFLRVIALIKKHGGEDKALEPEATLELGRVNMKLERWEDAKNNFATINKNKRWFKSEPIKRAESNFNYGVCLEKVGDIGGAVQAFTGVWVTYERHAEWSTQALEKWIDLGFQDADTNIKDPIALKQKKIEFYKILKVKMYKWHKWEETDALRRLRRRLPEMRTEIGITPAEEKALDFELGLDQVEQPGDGKKDK